MHIKDVLREINKRAGVESQELESLISSSTFSDENLTISDEEAQKITDNLINFEAAKNNSDLKDYYKQQLYGEMKGELLGNLDTEIKNTAKAFLSEDVYEQVKNTENSKDKMKLLKDNLNKQIEEIKNSAGDSTKDKEQIKKYQEKLEELEQTKQKELEEKDKQLNETLNEHKNKMIKKDLSSKLKNYQLSDAYNDDNIRSMLEQSAIDNLTSKAKLDYDENGNLKAFDPNNPEMELYEGSKKVDIDSKLQEFIQPYTKKSNGQGDGDNQQDTKPKPEMTKEPDPNDRSLAAEKNRKKQQQNQKMYND